MEILGVELFITIILISGFFEFLDSSMGMGYGTSLAPILLLMGFTPLQVVPAMLLTQTVGGSFAGFFHHEFGNVNFSLSPISKDTKVMFFIASMGVLATVVSVTIAVNLPANIVMGYVAFLVILMGVLALI
ncbi:MAG TPA: sulfite exporter TauE/SafE family protein, partial [Euryarchaeota archaeon]|nr:sulfite exporter TauE/SafE family protein [Euryarchaeota archaeon]